MSKPTTFADPYGDTILVVEYQCGRPFSVATERRMYDFDRKRGVGLVWHVSGGGTGRKATYHLGEYVEAAKVPGAVWAAPGITLVRTRIYGRGFRSVPVDATRLLRMGIRVLSEHKGNPFDVASEAP